jgi:hypothetical protein
MKYCDGFDVKSVCVWQRFVGGCCSVVRRQDTTNPQMHGIVWDTNPNRGVVFVSLGRLCQNASVNLIVGQDLQRSLGFMVTAWTRICRGVRNNWFMFPIPVALLCMKLAADVLPRVLSPVIAIVGAFAVMKVYKLSFGHGGDRAGVLAAQSAAADKVAAELLAQEASKPSKSAASARNVRQRNSTSSACVVPMFSRLFCVDTPDETEGYQTESA